MSLFLAEPGHLDHHVLDKEALARRQFLQDQLFMFWGKQLSQCLTLTKHVEVNNRRTRPPIHEPQKKIYPFSDQRAVFNKFISDLLSYSRCKTLCKGRSFMDQRRVEVARLLFRDGSTYTQRIIWTAIFLLFEITMPLLWILLFISALFFRVLLETGVRFPLLWLFYFTISGCGLLGVEALPPGEHGYTTVFQGGQHIDLDELEKELMKRNQESSNNDAKANVHTICISYKHFANKGKIPGDDNRICRTDLRAIAQLIKAAGPCKIRLWIDTKLPRSNDATFERWLNRGVRPYGRYITFFCPSARQYAQSSFWLANEYHFACSAKGALYFEGNEIVYDLRYGYQLDLRRRFLHVLIGAERHPVQVRDEDKGKVIEWAMCCLRADERGIGAALSPNIDNMTMVGKYQHSFALMENILCVVRKFGPQELPVKQGRSWDKRNPLLLAGLRDQKFDLSTWYGMSLDGYPTTVYFLHEEQFAQTVCLETVLVLEVTLDSPLFNPGKIHVVRKVLRELDSSVIMKCKFVAVPWLCDWE